MPSKRRPPAAARAPRRTVRAAAPKLTVRPLTPERWPDLEAVFNARGCSVARNCWCMYYRRSGSRGPLPAGTTYAQANRADLRALVDAGEPPGLIGYLGRKPVGWVSLGPREDFAKLRRSPVMKPIADRACVSLVGRPCVAEPDSSRRKCQARTN